MTRAILSGDVGAAGHLRQALQIEDVVGLAHNPVWGPLPTDEALDAFFGARADRREIFWQSARGPLSRAADPDRLASLLDFVAAHDRTELWFGPTVADQIRLIQLLSVLGANPGLEIVHVPRPVTEYNRSELATLGFQTESVRDAHIAIARSVWNSYRAQTPDCIADLVARGDFSPLPALRPALLALLDELPDTETGLGATERALIAILSRGGRSFSSLLDAYVAEGPKLSLDILRADALTLGLARPPEPAILGLPDAPDPGTLPSEKGRAERGLPIALSPLGEALAERRTDLWARHRGRRWWGNSELAPGNVWRWDSGAQRLVPPR